MAFDDLPDLLWDIDDAHSKTTYQTNFSWIDKIRAVKGDPNLLERLKGHTLELLIDDTDNLTLAPPEIVDWDDLAGFTYDFGEKQQYSDLQLDDYLAAVDKSRMRGLTIEKLESHRVVVTDGNGATRYKWPVFRCLSAAFEFNGKQYVLDEGHFYCVDANYMEELREHVSAIPIRRCELPDTTASREEADYNKLDAVGDRKDRLLLDRKTVKPTHATSGFEICDVMTASGELIHVKRKLGSSTLSHLFAQGHVSGRTIHAGPGFRQEVREEIRLQARETGRSPETFATYIDEPFAPDSITVVYAILANWKGKGPEDRLPFFSMVNLRHHNRGITEMGFKVALAPMTAD